MNREETIKAIVDYIKDDNAKYAILINGNWGCGKTYLYKNHVVAAINDIELGKLDRKDNAYISLYGVSSIEELSRALLIRFIALKTSNGTGDKEEIILKSAGVLELISSSISFNIKNFSVGGIDKIYDKILKLMKSKNLVICLDDLERCAIPVNEIFGWINNLTEHCNCKVIILADEANIGKMYANHKLEEKYLSILNGRRLEDVDNTHDSIADVLNASVHSGKSQNDSTVYEEISIEKLKELNEKVFSENYLYKDIKEKVIGETINYRPSVEDTFNDLLSIASDDEVNISQYKKYLRRKSSQIKSEFGQHSGDINYRTVMFWIDKFKRIYDECSAKYGNDEDSMEMLEIYLKSSIASVNEYKSNRKLTHTSEGSNSFVQYSQYGQKIQTFPFVDAWIRSSSWQESSFIHACADVRRMIVIERHRNPNEGLHSKGKALSKLYDWSIKPDQDVKKDISDLIIELKDGKYIYYDFYRILNCLVFLYGIELCTKEELDMVAKIMKEQIEKSDVFCEIRSVPLSFENENEKELFDNYYTPLLECAKKHNKEYRIEEANREKAFTDASDFKQLCSDFYDTFYENRSFIGFIGKDRILELIKKSNLEEKYMIINAIEKVYAALSVKEYFSEDLGFIKQLIGDLDSEGVFGQGKTDEFCKAHYKKVLNAVQEKLK